MESRGSYVTEIATLFPLQGEWTEGDYFALPDTMRTIELSDGELIVNPPPSTAHQQIAGNLYAAVREHVVSAGLGMVFFAPTAVRLWEGKIREPDVLFIRRENAGRIGPLAIEGPPDWVAEVISPGTRQVDEEDKPVEYARAGIAEYWLLDSDNRTIRVYVLEGESYRLAATCGPGQVARSVTLKGFEAAVDAIIPPAQ